MPRTSPVDLSAFDWSLSNVELGAKYGRPSSSFWRWRQIACPETQENKHDKAKLKKLVNKPFIGEDVVAVKGYVPKSSVDCLDAHLNWGWRNRLVITLCDVLAISLSDNPQNDSFSTIIERGFLAMAPNDETRELIAQYLSE